MYSAFILLTGMLWLFTGNNAENPSYDQGVYKPQFLNYCFEERKECEPICGCMLDRKCMVRPMPSGLVLAIMEKHNEVRTARVASEPKASGMAQLSYDIQLQEISACWAAKCNASVTDCLLTESYSEVAMNVGMIKIEDLNTAPFLDSPYSDTKPLEELWRTMLEGWAREVDTIQFQQPWSKKDQAEAKQGAQMIHDQTMAVGCSWAASPEGVFFFCAYGPALKDGDPVYKIGDACSTCPPGLKCNEDSHGLCKRYKFYPAVKGSKSPKPSGIKSASVNECGSQIMTIFATLVTSISALLKTV